MSPVKWFILGFVLTVLEIVHPAFVIFWFGIAGVVTGVIALFWHYLPAQIAIFVILSGVLVLLGQRISRRWTKHSPENVGSERLHDAHGEVTTRINPPDMGMVKVLGEIWRAESDAAIEVGASIRVKKVIGNHLVVGPKTESQQ